jgi:hypothetical protein
MLFEIKAFDNQDKQFEKIEEMKDSLKNNDSLLIISYKEKDNNIKQNMGLIHVTPEMIALSIYDLFQDEPQIAIALNYLTQLKALEHIRKLQIEYVKDIKDEKKIKKDNGVE